MPNVVIADAKGDFDFPGSRIVTDPFKLSRLRKGDSRPILYQPHPDFCSYPYWDAFFKWIYERKHTTVGIDELYAVFKLGQENKWLRACMTRGRSRHIRTIACTQRPFSIPLEILSESDHRFLFQLDMRDDKKRMAELMGPLAMQEIETRYSFLYYNRITRETPSLHILKL